MSVERTRRHGTGTARPRPAPGGRAAHGSVRRHRPAAPGRARARACRVVRGAGPAGLQPLPRISIQPRGVAGPQTGGLWNHVRAVSTQPTRALLASGRAWSIELIFGVADDCYEFTSPGSP